MSESRQSLTHVIDTLASTKGRDQPIMRIEAASRLVSLVSDELLTDPNTVFLDPFCKGGEVLLAMTLRVCNTLKAISTENLEFEAVNREIYSDRYFALAPDERHFLLSRRTFYGNERSHDSQNTYHIANGSYLSEEDGTLDRERFKEEFQAMLDFIEKKKPGATVVAIGNPPYQESDGGFGKSAKPIYHTFTEHLMDHPKIAQFVLVIPSRWFGGGKGLDRFRERILSSKSLKNLQHFPNSSDVFPTVDINGGVCFFHWDKKYNGPSNFSDGDHGVSIDFSDLDIIPDDPLAFSIVEKIKSQWDGQWIGDVAWARKPFGLSTDYFKKNSSLEADNTDAIPCLSIGRKILYASKKDITKNKDKISLWKVAVPKAAGGSKGKRRSTVPKNLILLIPPGTISTETYSVVLALKTKTDAQRAISYLKTDFARYLLGLRKITQDIPPDRWNWVPLIDTDREWTDEMLFDFFKLTPKERKHIQKKVEDWS